MMSKIQVAIKIALLGSFTLLATACSPEIGSDAWCEQLKEKAKGEWTATEAKDFTKHCIF